MQWLRENSFMVAAFLLPFAVVFFFLMATLVPRWLVEDPGADFYFALQDYSFRGETGLVYETVDSQVQASAYLLPQPHHSFSERLYRYRATERRVEEVQVEIPRLLREGLNARVGELEAWENNPTQIKPLPPNAPNYPSINFLPSELRGIRLSNNAVSNDGYRFEYEYRNNGLFAELFAGNHRARLVFVKDGRRVVLDVPGHNILRYYGHEVNILGWAL